MCFCPICKMHCNSGDVKGHGHCEFWDPDNNDCRIRTWFFMQAELLTLQIRELQTK